jgi:hypothetical protein
MGRACHAGAERRGRFRIVARPLDWPVLAAWGIEEKAEQLRQSILRLRLFTVDGHGHAITYGRAETLLA